MVTVNALPAIDWLEANNYGPAAAALQASIPYGADPKSFKLSDGQIEMLQAYNCPFSPASVPDGDWNGLMDEVKKRDGDNQLVIQNLHDWPIKSGPFPAFLKDLISEYCPNLAVTKEGSGSVLSKRSFPEPAAGLVPSDDSSSSDDDGGNLRQTPKASAQRTKKRRVRNSYVTKDSVVLGDLDVWVNNRDKIKGYFKGKLTRLLKEKLDANPAMSDEDALQLMSRKKLVAMGRSEAYRIVDRTWNGGRFEFRNGAARDALAAKIRAQINRWSSSWQGEIEAGLAGKDPLNTPTAAQFNIKQRFKRTAQEDHLALQFSSLGGGGLVVGAKVKLACAYLSIESADTDDEGRVFYTARHSYGEMLRFRHPPWSLCEKLTFQFPAWCLSAVLDYIVDDEDWDRAVEACQMSLRSCVLQGMLDEANPSASDDHQVNEAEVLGKHPATHESTETRALLSAPEQGQHPVSVMSALHVAHTGTIDVRRATGRGVVGARSLPGITTQLHDMNENHLAQENEDGGGDDDHEHSMIEDDEVHFHDDADCDDGAAESECDVGLSTPPVKCAAPDRGHITPRNAAISGELRRAGGGQLGEKTHTATTTTPNTSTIPAVFAAVSATVSAAADTAACAAAATHAARSGAVAATRASAAAATVVSAAAASFAGAAATRASAVAATVVSVAAASFAGAAATRASTATAAAAATAASTAASTASSAAASTAATVQPLQHQPPTQSSAMNMLKYGSRMSRSNGSRMVLAATGSLSSAVTGSLSSAVKRPRLSRRSFQRPMRQVSNAGSRRKPRDVPLTATPTATATPADASATPTATATPVDASATPTATATPVDASATPTATATPVDASATPTATATPVDASATPTATATPVDASATPTATATPVDASATPTATATAVDASATPTATATASATPVDASATPTATATATPVDASATPTATTTCCIPEGVSAETKSHARTVSTMTQMGLDGTGDGESKLVASTSFRSIAAVCKVRFCAF